MAGADPGAATTASALVELRHEAGRLGIDLPPLVLGRFGTYIETLLLWRSRLSLTTAATAEVIVRHHVIDSLHLARFIHPRERVADVGSGAGFPGMVLAIACPEASFTLIESRRKRANFLREVARTAQLDNVEVSEGRAEALAGTAPFGIVTSRALGRVRDFLAMAAPLLRSGGIAIAMKGPKGREEAQSPHAGFSAPDIVAYRLAGGAARALLVYRRD